MKTDAAGNFRVNLLIVITDIVSEFCTNILLIRSIKGMFYSLLTMIYDHEINCSNYACLHCSQSNA